METKDISMALTAARVGDWWNTRLFLGLTLSELYRTTNNVDLIASCFQAQQLAQRLWSACGQQVARPKLSLEWSLLAFWANKAFFDAEQETIDHLYEVVKLLLAACEK